MLFAYAKTGKDADQLGCNCTDHKWLCFCYIDSIIHLPPKLKKFKSLAIFCACTARFVSDRDGNPEDRFSCDSAQITQFIPDDKS